MKITNLIRSQRELIFGETFYLIDIYDEEDPYTVGRSTEEQGAYVDQFQKHFEDELMREGFGQLLSLVPYFSWSDSTSYWDLNFALQHTLERSSEYEPQRMRLFFEAFDFRRNELAEDMLQRLNNFTVSHPLELYTSDDEILLTYFPDSKSALQTCYGDEIDASLRAKVVEIEALNSANAWANLIPLMDESYDNKLILKMVLDAQNRLSVEEKDRLRDLVTQASMSNPITEYWRHY